MTGSTQPVNPEPATWTITELAREFDLTTRTIRFYEDRGLLHPTRRGQQRVYSRSDRTRLKLVLRGKRLGWPLDEIARMIELYDTPDGEKKQLKVMLERIQESRHALLRQADDIALALREFEEIEARCQQQLTQLARSERTRAAPAGDPVHAD